MAGGLLSGALVNLDVEGNEQQQVTGEDQVAVKCGQLGTITVTNMGQGLEVLVCVVGVSGEVDKAQVQDKLDDLETGDPLLPPDADTTGTQKVVPVHDTCTTSSR